MLIKMQTTKYSGKKVVNRAEMQLTNFTPLTPYLTRADEVAFELNTVKNLLLYFR
jgi:hypothetical protein